MIRCIAIDLDDTLLKTDLTIAGPDREAISRAEAKGVKVLLASGRMVQSMKPYAEELGLDVPLIAYNGAVVQEAVSGEILYHRPVPPQEALEVLTAFRRSGIHLNVYVNDQLYMDQLTAWGERYATNARVKAHIADLTGLLKEHSSHKMLGVGEVDQIDALQNQLQSQFGDALYFVKSKPTYLEILAPGVSKGRALQELTAGWGFSREEVMAIGDAPNDLSMIRWAGTGVAIGNASEGVKNEADFVVADHDHCGVAEAIRRAVGV